MNTKQTQNLDPQSSPHLEEEWIGGMVDLDLLSCFPKFGQESLEGSGGNKLSKMCNNGGEREQKVQKVREPLGKKAPLNRFPEKSGRWAQIPAGPVVPAQRAVLPPYAR